MLVHAVELGECRAQQSMRVGCEPDPREMRLQQIEEEPVALGEVAAAAAASGASVSCCELWAEAWSYAVQCQYHPAIFDQCIPSSRC